MRSAVLALLVLVGPTASAQLTEAERAGLRDTLLVGNLTLDDLKFERKPFRDRHRLPAVDEALDDPLASADRQMGWHAAALGGNMLDQFRRAVDVLGVARTAIPSAAIAPLTIEGATHLPPSLRATVESLARTLVQADAVLRDAFSGLTPEEQRELVEGLPGWAVGEPKVTFDFVRREPAEQARLLELLAKVNFPAVLSAAELVVGATERAAQSLRANTEPFVGKHRYRVGGLPVVMGGRGDDIHDETDARITIDLGGDDLYVGRHGAGVTYCAVLIDVAGNDEYRVRDLSVGAGLLGVGVARDLGGDDAFRGRSLNFGAGLAGVGLFVKSGGDDLYQNGALSQGFGQFGVGLCLDSAGDDKYAIKLMGQGAGRTQGVGWLIDRAGSDQYRAGGLSLSEPLFTGVHYSFAQGFGMGYREDTGGVSGGVGLLTDGAGDDFYLGETYAQGASYWLALGSLYDAGGNDTYTGHHYSQASAMHICGAYLFDLAGADAYVVKVGAAHAIGHDYGVAFLLDRAGDDLYASQDSTPGIGNANGLGIFLEGGGNDRYHGPPGKGNPARGTGSLGVFVDQDGADLYRFGLADAQAAATDSWGVAYDLETRLPPVSAASGQAGPPAATPGSLPMPPEAEMAELYRLGTQWAVGSAQAEVQGAVARLVGIGVPALEWMLENRLLRADRLQIRAFVAVTQGIGDAGRLAVARRALTAPAAERPNLLAIAMEAQVTDVGAILAPWIDDPATQVQAVRAAGPLRATGAVPHLSRLCLSEDALLARSAMVSLMQIGDVSTIGTAQSMLNSGDLLTRKAAVALIAKFPAEARTIGEALSREPDERRARQGLEILGAVGSPEALRTIGMMLMDPRVGVRLEALVRLAGRVPDAFRPTVDELARDPVPVVRAVARRVAQG